MPTADARNLQRRRVYDVAVAATECNQTQAHCAREAVIKCRCMEVPGNTSRRRRRWWS